MLFCHIFAKQIQPVVVFVVVVIYSQRKHSLLNCSVRCKVWAQRIASTLLCLPDHAVKTQRQNQDIGKMGAKKKKKNVAPSIGNIKHYILNRSFM